MKSVSITIIISLIFLLTGCWDQSLLVNKTFINGISFDLTEDGKILSSVRTLSIQNKGGGQFEVKDEVIQASRQNISGLSVDINKSVPGQIDASKAYVILIGEELAKKGIHPILEAFYRNKNAYVSSKVVIVEGKGSDILSLNPETSPIAFVILKGLQAAEKSTEISNESVFTAWPQIVDPGKDIVLPYVTTDNKNKLIIAGVKLFNGDKYTGISLSEEKSSLLLLLMNRLDKFSQMAIDLDKNRTVLFKTANVNRDLKLKVNKSTRKITGKLDLKLNIDVLNYSNKPGVKINIEKLNNELASELTKQLEFVTNSLLKANCDALGIGRILSSSYPEIWKKIDWEKEYKNVQFDIKVKVNIEKTGSVF
ncbi:Ger(x)C family spore germination protein [Bacillus sp. AFS017336]|uniref:Ger(x)C family spore germination protein n=1 Tax=Bacillus sp. AFS017336 TaxID=2033489 RepID=UPI000BF06D96|nr:Ger(x)C family spore germination protein [Bacillus sp. AFS017336]PEL13858.1 hypothetical protein CN601_02845 [Bacillus sp. AFS017336]